MAEPAPPPPVAVCIETGGRRAVASALEWPGWCRSGRDEAAALEALGACADRYAAVAAEAGLDFFAARPPGLRVAERLAGSATTDFGVPGAVAQHDLRALDGGAAARLASLLRAAWTVFDLRVAASPAELRRGPRGGGRDRDAVVSHVLGAESEYARRIGLRLSPPAVGDPPGALAEFREAIAERLAAPWNGPLPDRAWPPRYAIRRFAYHVVDHAWEIEDRRLGS